MTRIRRALPEDIAVITEIYNEAILTTDVTFDIEPKTIAEQKAWFAGHGERNPIIVVEIDAIVRGWASISQWSSRCAYSDTAEISLYVKQEYRHQGLGRLLFRSILLAGQQAGLHTVLSRITAGNGISIHLHEQYGFKNIGDERSRQQIRPAAGCRYDAEDLGPLDKGAFGIR
jgi:L-amino acid N-acyltransferase YncA